MASVRELSEAELDAYHAPFPDERYTAGARVLPTLVRSQQATNREAWKALQAFDKPFLTTFSDSAPITSGGEKVFQKRVPAACNQRPSFGVKQEAETRTDHERNRDDQEMLDAFCRNVPSAPFSADIHRHSAAG